MGDDVIDSVKASGQLAYCQVTAQPTKEQPELNQKVMVWGKIPRGLNMQLQDSVNTLPTEFKEIKMYNFSDVQI